jgi:glycosyltransferase involved in cell wall biosynthesis
MHVAIDSRMILHSGIGVYLRQLLRHLPEAIPDLRLTLLGDPGRIAEAQVPGEVTPFRRPIYAPWPLLRWPAPVQECDLIHCPHYNLPARAPRPAVVTVHDLIHFLGPGALRGIRLWRAHRLFASALHRARAVIVISEATRQDLLRVFPGVDRSRLHLVRNGLDPAFGRPSQEEDRRWREQLGLPENHWLAVGIDKPHKNYSRLLRRMRAWFDLEGAPAWPLVIIGPDPRAFRRRHARDLRALGDRVHVLDPIDPERMRCLMRGAVALLMPSLREGFGLPAGEAMAAGVPVVAHAVASLPEVVGDAGALLDPEDDRGWLEAMMRLAVDADWRGELGARGRERARGFRWEEAAAQTAEVYRAALG